MATTAGGWARVRLPCLASETTAHAAIRVEREDELRRHWDAPVRRARTHWSGGVARRLLSVMTPEKRGFDGRWPDAEKSAAFRSGAEPMNRAWRDEHEGAWPDSFSGVGVGVEGVLTLEDVEGLCFVVSVWRVIEAGVLPCLSEGPVPTGLGSGCFADDPCVQATHRQEDAVSLGGPAQHHLRSVSLGHYRPPITDGSCRLAPSIVPLHCSRGYINRGSKHAPSPGRNCMAESSALLCLDACPQRGVSYRRHSPQLRFDVLDGSRPPEPSLGRSVRLSGLEAIVVGLVRAFLVGVGAVEGKWSVLESVEETGKPPVVPFGGESPWGSGSWRRRYSATCSAAS